MTRVPDPDNDPQLPALLWSALGGDRFCGAGARDECKLDSDTASVLCDYLEEHGDDRLPLVRELVAVVLPPWEETAIRALRDYSAACDTGQEDRHSWIEAAAGTGWGIRLSVGAHAVVWSTSPMWREGRIDPSDTRRLMQRHYPQGGGTDGVQAVTGEVCDGDNGFAYSRGTLLAMSLGYCHYGVGDPRVWRCAGSCRRHHDLRLVMPFLVNEKGPLCYRCGPGEVSREARREARRKAPPSKKHKRRA